jgi:hypothetical protein
MHKGTEECAQYIEKETIKTRPSQKSEKFMMQTKV